MSKGESAKVIWKETFRKIDQKKQTPPKKNQTQSSKKRKRMQVNRGVGGAGGIRHFLRDPSPGQGFKSIYKFLKCKTLSLPWKISPVELVVLHRPAPLSNWSPPSSQPCFVPFKPTASNCPQTIGGCSSHSCANTSPSAWNKLFLA